MAYLGNAPKQNLNTMNSQQFSGDGSTVNFTLSQSVANTAEAEVYVGNVRQDPFSAYSISGGTTLAFTGSINPGENSIQAGMISAINGGYKNLATVSEAITVAATDNMMLCGPVAFTNTVTVNGTLTVV
jgi:hypothetical protein